MATFSAVGTQSGDVNEVAVSGIGVEDAGAVVTPLSAEVELAAGEASSSCISLPFPFLGFFFFFFGGGETGDVSESAADNGEGGEADKTAMAGAGEVQGGFVA